MKTIDKRREELAGTILWLKTQTEAIRPQYGRISLLPAGSHAKSPLKPAYVDAPG